MDVYPNPNPNNTENNNTNLQVDIAKSRRPTALIAALGIVGVGGGTVGALAYDLIINGSGETRTVLGTLATLAVGGLLALAGAKNGGNV